jgi:hypothetical protein
MRRGLRGKSCNKERDEQQKEKRLKKMDEEATMLLYK